MEKDGLDVVGVGDFTSIDNIGDNVRIQSLQFFS